MALIISFSFSEEEREEWEGGAGVVAPLCFLTVKRPSERRQ